MYTVSTKWTSPSWIEGLRYRVSGQRNCRKEVEEDGVDWGILVLDPHSCVFLTNLSSFVSFWKANKLHHSIDPREAWVTGLAHFSLDTVTKEERFFFLYGQDEVWWGGCLETVAAEHVEEVACGEKYFGFWRRTLSGLWPLPKQRGEKEMNGQRKNEGALVMNCTFNTMDALYHSPFSHYTTNHPPSILSGSLSCILCENIFKNVNLVW